MPRPPPVKSEKPRPAGYNRGRPHRHSCPIPFPLHLMGWGRLATSWAFLLQGARSASRGSASPTTPVKLTAGGIPACGFGLRARMPVLHFKTSSLAAVHNYTPRAHPLLPSTGIKSAPRTSWPMWNRISGKTSTASGTGAASGPRAARTAPAIGSPAARVFWDAA